MMQKKIDIYNNWVDTYRARHQEWKIPVARQGKKTPFFENKNYHLVRSDKDFEKYPELKELSDYNEKNYKEGENYWGNYSKVKDKYSKYHKN